MVSSPSIAFSVAELVEVSTPRYSLEDARTYALSPPYAR